MDSLGAVHKTILAIVVACVCWVFVQFHVEAAELNTKLPVESDAEFSVPITIDIPSQPLAAALNQLGKSANLNIAFPSDLVLGKTSPAVKGRMSRKEALQRILANSGLAAKMDEGNAYIERASKDDKNIQLDKVEVRAKRFYEIGPLPGLGLTKDQIPGNVQSITAKEIKDSHSLSITDLMNKKLQSVTVNDYQGNPFQMDVQYRGFTAGPQIGTPQGLSVFFDGIRVNEPFGDVVNWDMIPMNALAGVDVFPGSNPIFGLNTLGGAFTLKTKDGFNNAGVDAEVLTGSFGRKQFQVEGGVNNGTFALFGAGNFFLEDGWRENSPSKVNQLFTKASYRGDKLDLNLSTLWVGTDLVGNGLLPSEMYAQDRNGSFTSEDTTKNRLSQFQLSSSYFVNDNFTVTGQVYRRNSKRHQKGADVFTGIANDDNPQNTPARRLPGINPVTGTPEEYTCLFASTNTFGYRLPDYYLLQLNETAGQDFFTPGSRAYDFVQEFYSSGGIISSSFDDLINVALTPQDGFTGTPLISDYASLFERDFNFNRNFTEASRGARFDSIPSPPTFINPFGTQIGIYATTGSEIITNSINIQPGQNVIDPDASQNFYFYSQNGNGDIVKNILVFKTPTNVENCASTHSTNGIVADNVRGGRAYTYTDVNGNVVFVDGAGGGGGTQPGVVEGTPTSIFNDNQINQVVDGASIQFNWNLEHHKFMVGASIDAADADYKNASRLGLLTADREAYLDPANIHPMFGGALIALSNNNFEGTQTTKSLYFSETWTPVDTWHFNASGRYNVTQTKNKIAARSGFYAFDIAELINTPDEYNLCNGDCSVNPPSTNYRLPRLANILDPAETEKFSFHSFNPSLGAIWQAQENLNLYANWAKGTRVPSVIELGCAFDRTPIQTSIADTDGDGIGDTPVFTPKSIVENRTCTLPTTLSGDPFLPQIKATTYDIGVRGTLGDTLQWNLSTYQTDLKDDIYFVTVATGSGFFDSIGKTRRRGIEAGLSGKKDKWGFSLNYGLTDATFQDNFLMLSENNSSSRFVNGYGNVIRVEKGNRIPGVALHNLNASVSYDVTPQWQVGLTAIAHSESFVRGNENNQHKQGAIRRVIGTDPITGNPIFTPPTTNPGTVPGYATFNFQTSYRFSKEWTGTMFVNNVFDREYFTAGRLGRNPFSPSIYGAIGPDGYNHNSNDWLSTNFIAPGAPRGIWFSLNYQFVPDRK